MTVRNFALLQIKAGLAQSQIPQLVAQLLNLYDGHTNGFNLTVIRFQASQKSLEYILVLVVNCKWIEILALGSTALFTLCTVSIKTRMLRVISSNYPVQIIEKAYPIQYMLILVKPGELKLWKEMCKKSVAMAQKLLIYTEKKGGADENAFMRKTFMFKNYIDTSALLGILCFKISSKCNYFLMRRSCSVGVWQLFTIRSVGRKIIYLLYGKQLAFKYRRRITVNQKWEDRGEILSKGENKLFHSFL